MTSKSKTLKTKVTPAAKKPVAKTPAKVVKAVAAKKVVTAKAPTKKVINNVLGEQIKAAIVTKAKVEATKATKQVLKSVFGNENNKAVIVKAKKKAPAKKAAKPVTSIKTAAVPKPSNVMARSKLVPASVALKPKAIAPATKISGRTISMSDLAKNLNAATTAPKPSAPNVPVKRDEDVGTPYLRTPVPTKGKGLSMQEVMGSIATPRLGGAFFPTKS